MTGVCVFAYLLVFVAIAAWFGRRQGYFSPVVVFGIGAFYYYSGIPLELWLQGQVHVPGDFISYSFYPGDQVHAVLMTMLALAGFALGFQWSGFKLLRDVERPEQFVTQIPRSVVMIGALAMVIILAGYGTAFLSGLGDYYEGNSIRRNNALLTAMINYVALSILICSSLMVQGSGRQKLVGILLGGLLIYWGIYTKDKNPMCQGAIALMSPYLGSRSRSPLTFIGICLGAFLVIGGLPLFSAFRAGESLNLARFGAGFSVLDTDARGPAASFAIAISEPSDWECGQTYINAALLMIPRFLWPDRPADLAEQFAYENISAERWFDGAGFGFSLMTEAYMNFGTLGSFIQYALIGFLLGRIWMWTQRQFSGAHWPFWRAMYACNGMMCLVIMHRGAVNQIGRYLLYYLFVPLIIYWIIDLRPGLPKMRTSQPKLNRLPLRQRAA